MFQNPKLAELRRQYGEAASADDSNAQQRHPQQISTDRNSFISSQHHNPQFMQLQSRNQNVSHSPFSSASQGFHDSHRSSLVHPRSHSDTHEQSNSSTPCASMPIDHPQLPLQYSSPHSPDVSHDVHFNTLLQASIGASSISNQLLQVQQTQQQMITEIRDTLLKLSNTVETIAQRQSRIEDDIASACHQNFRQR